MSFKTDTQTINDLRIFGDNTGKDIFGIFNKTRTGGGAKLLKDMFSYPLATASEIEYRVNSIRFFMKKKITFPFSSVIFDTIEFYLSNTDERSRLTVQENNLKRKLDQMVGADVEYQQLQQGVSDTLHFLIGLDKFILNLGDEGMGSALKEVLKKVSTLLNKDPFVFIKNADGAGKLNFDKTVQYDELFRFRSRNDILKLLRYAYEIDVFTAVADVAGSENFTFGEVNQQAENSIDIEGMFHPLVPNAVSNDLKIDEDNNMIFLTGANMAGKSTFMKTFCIVMYLAHMGFPIPVSRMRFSIQHGMFTTINLADNLNMGFSHFYAEVKRLKKVAEAVNNNERLIVVFDELFRGTNVKDAYEATIAVVEAFATKRKCTFIISTHIIEAGEVLKERSNNIRYLYLPTIMNSDMPEYTYMIKEGITEDRHGMMIIQNEQILDILKA
ncbi:MutS-related protein [Robertkochia solimangrovi]|uniref:MutS-related protein n=1 Tax=Robertkochia solimangrovi TaxID=2213046 RepID=UPI001181641E|nr:DNA mismatch repair protein [Robertkochia solimangrovi]TRZ42237.1 DNA mismatch repair protein [Robertkochia solimangrovi]